jgi:hypothetical protein
MTSLMKDLLTQRASDTFVGRADELEALCGVLDDRPRIAFVTGIAGIGKSTLIDEFATRARKLGAVVIGLDCHAIEPTERGFVDGLNSAIGGKATVVKKAAERLGSLSSRVVLTLDNYEVFRLMDTWLRQVFIPALPENVRVVLAGRDTPSISWLISPGWQGLVRSIVLEPLSEGEAIDLLVRSGAEPETAYQINRFAHGHPLALQLASRLGAERRNANDVMSAPGFQRVVEELTRSYMADVDDPVTRRALDAASVVRRITLSLIHAMLPDVAPQDAFERLRSLPFVKSERDGLRLHDLVHQAVGSSLRAIDPNGYQEYRRAAWRQLSTEARRTGLQELWRYTADLLYLIENPIVREAFFPTDSPQYILEPARSDDGSTILALARLHENERAVELIGSYWKQVPHCFQVARDKDNQIAGFYLMFDPSLIGSSLLTNDPITEQWCNHIRSEPVPDKQRVLFIRRWLDREHGEKPCAVQAACWLDIKRVYMEMRPHLRRVYLCLEDLVTYAPVALKLGFQPIPAHGVEIGGSLYSSAVVDFGPLSVDGWLSGLAAAELGVDEHEPFDRHAHELMFGDERIKLTKLEFELFVYLYQRKGKAVTRASLIEDVWGWKQTGSNVIEAVIRSLRKKLGTRAAAIETIRGSGYRFRGL